MSMGSEFFAEYAYEISFPFGMPCGNDPLWKTRESKRIPVSKMTTAHIQNCMRIVGEDDDWYWAFQKELDRRANDGRK